MPKEASLPPSQSLPPAPAWRRLAAIGYDSLLVLALIFIVGFLNLAIQLRIYGSEKLRIMTEQGQSLGGPLFYATLLMTIISFFAFFWTRQGQTLGMQAWRIKIINPDGNTISVRQCLLRIVVATPSLLMGGIGVLWAKWDKDKLSWQDRLSGSKTVHIA